MVAPGVLCGEVDAAAGQHGLRFPVDPSSAEFCTVGGMAATNAAGAHTLKYGSMRPWVTALDCVFADGSRALVRRGEPLSPATRQIPAIAASCLIVAPKVRSANVESLRHPGVRKESSGYALAEYAQSDDLVDLLVGSEGTLAIFVGMELALTPRPAATASVLAATTRSMPPFWAPPRRVTSGRAHASFSIAPSSTLPRRPHWRAHSPRC